MALATLKDIETSLLRQLTESEKQYAGPLLERAELLLRVRIPDLLDKAAEDETFRQLVVAIEAEAVARVFRNPSAYRQETEGNYSYSLNFEVASGLLDILDREWDRLGFGGYGALAPQTDGYLRSRRGGDPAFHFQARWPAYDQHSCGGEFWI